MERASEQCLIVAAVAGELAPLRRLAAGRPELPRWRELITGVGQLNAALATERALREDRPRRILQIGCAGAFSAAARPGDLLVATEEILADDGAEDGDRFLDRRELGFALAAREGVTLYNSIPLEPPSPEWIAARAREFRVHTGPFVTVSTVTGTRSRAERLRQRYDPVAENLEGAAVALVAWQHRVPFTELRGVSNAVGPRDRASWNLAAACETAARAAIDWLLEA